jgi:type VI secretion system secreted protein VgrG
MAYTQEGRVCVLETPLGKDVLILTRMSAVEAVSELFRLQLGLVSHEGEIDFASIIGKSVTVDLNVGDGSSRFFNGIVSRFSQGGTYGVGSADTGLVFYEAEVVPWMWLLTRTTNCRVWENKTVIEILEDVLGDPKYGGAPYEFGSLSGTYKPIEYCVQYRETDFNFVSRMMEEEGLFYAFRHENGKHTLVISDTSANCPDCPGHETLSYESSAASRADVKMVESWSVDQVMPPGKYALDGYDFKSPSDDLLAPTQSAISLGGNSKFEVFDVPTNYFASKQGSRYVKLRMEVEEAASHQVRAQSVCGGLTAGTHITLKDHYCDAYNNKRYLLTRVQHKLTESTGYEGGAAVTAYENSFTCLPERIAYRPQQKTEKPTIPGTQTALVVGPSGEEIHCDEYARVRIQFYWDRNGPTDGTAVCWARVSQSLAGKKWGSIYLPRIGQEVVVTFLDGDPDRPLITGMVYNAEQMPPYALPDNKTQSGIKTRSSKGGDPATFNEIRFEDKKGAEELYVHAEKDMNEVVENDQSSDVGHDRSRKVGNDETVEVGNNREVKIAKNQTTEIGGEHSEMVEKTESLSVGESRTRSVKGQETIAIKKSQSISVDEDRSIDVGKSLNLDVAQDYKQKTGKTVLIDAGDELTLKSGSAKIVMKKNGDIQIQGKKITVKGSSDVVIKGSKIAEN